MDVTGLPHHELLDLAGRALAEANRRDLTTLTDGEVTEATLAAARVRTLADAAHVATVGRLATSKAWREPGARSAGGARCCRCCAGPTCHG